MNKQEKIQRFKEQIAQLAKELKEFEESDNGEFKKGDWVELKVRNEIWLMRISNISNDFYYGCGIMPDGWFDGERLFKEHRRYTYRKLTPSEIESALRKEWNRRCIEAGWDSGDEAEIEGHAGVGKLPRKPNDGRCRPVYSPDTDNLWIKNGLIYSSGLWATPKPRKKAVKFFEWEVTEHDGYTQIGCRDLNNNFLSVLGRELQNVSDKTVQEVLDELKKLDL